MCAKYTREDIYIRKQTVETGGNHRSHRKAIGGGKRRNSGWHKEFYGRCISRDLYYAILEAYDSSTYKFDDNKISDVCGQLNVSRALVAAVVADR